MARLFDATLKHLIEAHPEDWLAQLGVRPSGPVRMVDADIATVSGAADKVLRLEEPQPWLLHLELQASRDEGLPRRMLRYNVLLDERHDLPVHSVVLLLRKEADGPHLTGEWTRQPPVLPTSIVWRYSVRRLWQTAVDDLLKGGIGTLPLAPLAAVHSGALPAVVRAMEVRVNDQLTPSDAAEFWVSTYILLGLRYPRGFARNLLKGVRAMKESTTYRAILEEGEVRGLEKGRVEEVRRLILLMGEPRFGPAGTTVRAELERRALEELELLALRLHQSETWGELLSA